MKSGGDIPKSEPVPVKIKDDTKSDPVNIKEDTKSDPVKSKEPVKSKDDSFDKKDYWNKKLDLKAEDELTPK